MWDFDDLDDDDEPSQDWDDEPPMPDPDPMLCDNCGELHVCYFDYTFEMYLCDACDTIADVVRDLIYGPPPPF